jgi:thiamine-monophosphate kinase
MRLFDIGEFGLIARIARRLPTPGEGVVVGIGDDTAALRVSGDRLLLATCDIQLEGHHFLRDKIAPQQLGRKALAINLSDIASMGGRPRYALVSLGLPKDLAVAWVDALYDGLQEEAARFSTSIVGGNITGSPLILVDITLLGEVEEERLLRRSGARVGDRLLVTGTLGASGAGLAWLVARGEGAGEQGSRGAGERRGRGAGEQRSRGAGERRGRGAGEQGSRGAGERRGRGAGEQGSRGAEHLGTEVDEVLAAHFTPTPRVPEGQAIGATRAATAMIDLSDGLASDVGHICELSRVGVLVEAARLPISPATRAVAEALGRAPVAFALFGGEDYELLLTAPAERIGELIAAVGQTGTPLTDIGEIVPAAAGRTLLLADGRTIPLEPGGWDHFRR